MRSRSAPVPGRPSGDAEASGRRVTCKAPLAHLEEGSGRSKTSPTAILQCTHSLEEEFSEVRTAPVRGGSAAARGADEHGVAHLPGGPDSVSEARTERVAARDPDVAGRRCDRDGGRPCAPRDLVEDGPDVAVGGRRVLEPVRQEKLHQGGLTVALRGLLLAAPREPVDEESGEKQAENRERYGGRYAFGEGLHPALDGEGEIRRTARGVEAFEARGALEDDKQDPNRDEHQAREEVRRVQAERSKRDLTPPEPTAMPEVEAGPE